MDQEREMKRGLSVKVAEVLEEIRRGQSLGEEVRRAVDGAVRGLLIRISLLNSDFLTLAIS